MGSVVTFKRESGLKFRAEPRLNGGHKAPAKTFDTRAEAEDYLQIEEGKLRERIKEQQANKPVSASTVVIPIVLTSPRKKSRRQAIKDLTVGQAIDLYRAYMKTPDYRTTSNTKNVDQQLTWWEKESGLIDVLIEGSEDKEPLTQIDINLVKEKLKKKINSRTGTPIGIATVIQYLASLQAVISYSSALGMLKQKPRFTWVTRSERSQKQPRRRTISRDEEKNLIDAYLADTDRKRKNPFLSLVLKLNLATGARVSEIEKLEWSEIEWDKNLIRLSATRTKDREQRVLGLTDELMDLLAEQLKWCRNYQVKRGTHAWLKNPFINNSRYVFPSNRADKPRSCYKEWSKQLARAGILGVQRRDTRRTAGYRMLNSGKFSMEKIASMLGHSSIKVTEEVYADHEENSILDTMNEYQTTVL